MEKEALGERAGAGTRDAAEQLPSRRDLPPASPFAAGLTGGLSALVTGPAGTLALLTRTRTRLVRVRPPLDLPSFMDQVAQDAEAEKGFDLLTVPGADHDQVLLVVEEAHLLPEATLRYIEFALRAGPSLQVVFAGRAEAASLVTLDDFATLRARLLLAPVRSALPAIPPSEPVQPVIRQARSVAHKDPPGQTSVTSGRRTGLVAALAGSLVGVGLVVAAWLVGSTLAPVPGVVHVGPSTLQPDSPDVRVAAQFLPSAKLPVADPSARPAVSPVPSQVDPGGQAVLDAPAATATEAATTQPIPASRPQTTPVSLLPAASEQAAGGTQARPQEPAAAGVPDDAVKASQAAQNLDPGAQLQPTAPEITKPAMIALPGSVFRMGSGIDRSERPEHLVEVARFSIAEHATTVREWQECARAGMCDPQTGGKPQNPVTNISWDDARRYTEWLSGVTAQRYRLPTEAEWEYAARGGTLTRYAWGDTMLPGRSGCKGCGGPADLQDPPWVGAYPANPFALYGMGGGVAEWVADCWHRDYQGAPANGSRVWDTPDCRARVLRGGSWMEEAAAVRLASRESYDASVRYPTHGFRVALSP